MSRRAALATAFVALALAPAAGAADRTITIDPDHATATWQNTPNTGINPTFLVDGVSSKVPTLGTCGKDAYAYCDDTLVHFTSELPLDDSILEFRIEGFAHSDYDLHVYASDATGAAKQQLGQGKGDGAGVVKAVPTFMGDPETFSTDADPDSWYLVRVAYFTVPGDEAYTGKLSWTGELAGSSTD